MCFPRQRHSKTGLKDLRRQRHMCSFTDEPKEVERRINVYQVPQNRHRGLEETNGSLSGGLASSFVQPGPGVDAGAGIADLPTQNISKLFKYEQAGPHNCIGRGFSPVKMKAILFTLVRAFGFEPAVPEDMTIASPASIQKRRLFCISVMRAFTGEHKYIRPLDFLYIIACPLEEFDEQISTSGMLVQFLSGDVSWDPATM
ncbi:hypothetical protein DFH09DRAFT_1069154 [Mycena vulgaris]|nr:hypothetical protein DFH09DRAFT_1069154 [Mycena vulgaris]